MKDDTLQRKRIVLASLWVSYKSFLTASTAMRREASFGDSISY